MDMSINRALSELKLLNKKITDKTAKLQVAGTVMAKNTSDGEKTAFVDQANSGIQAIRDLIKRRNRIKSSIVMSNADTKVSIGGVSMTVAEAIERKSSIELDKALNRKMREGYFGQKQVCEQHNVKATEQANKQVEQVLGAATEGDKGTQAKAVFDAYYEANRAGLLAPDGIEAQIEKDQEAIDEFEMEVDFILSESNTKTTITVVD